MADPEIEAMSALAEALAPLEDDARGRVLRWASERFGLIVGSKSGDSSRVKRDGIAQADDDELTDEEISAEAPTFDHFAELFDAAGPKTNDDKALVAGYWFQVLKSQPTFKATELQKELTNLGHAIPNITDALTGNIKRKPARVLQIAKAGASKQARKTYKLTHEGLVYVQGMIGHAS